MAWDKTRCRENIPAPDLNDDIQANYEAIESDLNREHKFSTGGTATDQIIHRKGSARCYIQATAPWARVSGDAFTSDDNGSVWIASDNNKVYILVNYADPTADSGWISIESVTIATLLAAARIFAAGTMSLTLQNTTEEDGDGGRLSQLIGKGEQSGGEVTTLGALQFMHWGNVNDEKGTFRIVLNDGDDANTPSICPIQYKPDGKIAVAASLSVLDEDNMASDDAAAVPTQQSVKKFVEDQDAADHPAYAGGESHTDGSGLITKFGVTASLTNETVEVTYGAPFTTSVVAAFATPQSNSITLGQNVCVQPKPGFETTILEVTNGGEAAPIYWQAIGY